MNPMPRLLIAAALLALLAACGNKGALVRASDVPPTQPQAEPAPVEPAPVESLPATDPTDPAPPAEIAPPPAANPAAATAPDAIPTQAPPADGDDGNG